jgi:hypothetical protein
MPPIIAVGATLELLVRLMSVVIPGSSYRYVPGVVMAAAELEDKLGWL